MFLQMKFILWRFVTIEWNFTRLKRYSIQVPGSHWMGGSGARSYSRIFSMEQSFLGAHFRNVSAVFFFLSEAGSNLNSFKSINYSQTGFSSMLMDFFRNFWNWCRDPRHPSSQISIFLTPFQFLVAFNREITRTVETW